MKYYNKEQVKNLLFMSNLVNIDLERNLVQFIGNDLERCELKLSRELVSDILRVCQILEIKHQTF